MKDRILVWCWRNFRWLFLLIGWFAISIILLLYYSSPFVFSEISKTKLLPGALIDGHYQIEENCNACHSPFDGVPQSSCLNCHASELEAINDSHAISKFKDPRNAAKLTKINALECKSCHDDHEPDLVTSLGVTVEDRFCIHCHAKISDDRPSHSEFKFDKCRQCHNYHDNKALYEDFVKKHLDEPKNLQKTTILKRNFREIYPKLLLRSNKSLNTENHNGPLDSDSKVVQEWANSKHARSGVNCRDCHVSEEAEWTLKPEVIVCQNCHGLEIKSFLESRHGMRLNQKNLSPMTPRFARLAMKSDSFEKELNCNTCHGAHEYDTKFAQVESCLECHDDDHSLSYKKTPHFKIWNSKENSNKMGVSCSGCHLARREAKARGLRYVYVDHNQNNTLRPNQKMVRPICMNCHGLGFSLDALSDRNLIKNNFSGVPVSHLSITEMVKARIK